MSTAFDTGRGQLQRVTREENDDAASDCERTTMGRLFDLVEAYQARYEPHPPSISRVAEQVGVSRQTLLNWKTPTKLIDKNHLVALARVTGVPYATVRDALLDDIGWLYEDQEPAVAARRPRRASRADQQRDAQDADAESPDQ